MPKKSGKVEGEEDVFAVKSILKYEQRQGADFYLVEWAGYPVSEATWEPRSNFFNPSNEVAARLKALKEAYTKTKRTSVTVTNSPQDDINNRKSVNGTTGSSLRIRRTSDASNNSSKPAPKRKQRNSINEPTIKRTRGSIEQNESTKNSSLNGPKNIKGEDRLKNSKTDLTTLSRSVVHPLKENYKRADSSNDDDDQEASTSDDKLTDDARRCHSSASPRESSIHSQPRLANQTIPESEIIRVKSIRQDPIHGLCGIITSTTTAGTAQESRIPISEVRKLYPEELIDFLLLRIQFRSVRSGPIQSNSPSTTKASSIVEHQGTSNYPESVQTNIPSLISSPRKQ